MKLLGFLKRIKLEKHQHSLITGIARELNIPKEEVLFMFVEFGNTFMILSQEKENVLLAEDIDKRGHLKEYKHWKEIAKITYESWKIAKENNL